MSNLKKLKNKSLNTIYCYYCFFHSRNVQETPVYTFKKLFYLTITFQRYFVELERLKKKEEKYKSLLKLHEKNQKKNKKILENLRIIKEEIKKINKIFYFLIQELKIVLQNETKSNDFKKMCRILM